MERAYCFMMKMVCFSRSRFIAIDHCRGTVYATKTAMTVMMTSTPARVKPDCGFAGSWARGLVGSWAVSPRARAPSCPVLQLIVRHIVRRLPLRPALHVDDARRCAFIRFLGLGRIGSGRVFGAGIVLDGVPVIALRDRILRNRAEVVRHELLQIGRELLLVGVVVIDRLAHLVQVGAQRRFLRLLLRAADIDE